MAGETEKLAGTRRQQQQRPPTVQQNRQEEKQGSHEERASSAAEVASEGEEDRLGAPPSLQPHLAATPKVGPHTAGAQGVSAASTEARSVEEAEAQTGDVVDAAASIELLRVEKDRLRHPKSQHLPPRRQPRASQPKVPPEQVIASVNNLPMLPITERRTLRPHR